MFCSKCGKEISENTKFCSHCGAPQGGVVDEKPSDKKNKAKKNPKKVMLSLAAMLVCYLVGSYVIAPAMLSNKEDTDAGTSNSTDLTIDDDSMEDADNISANNAYSDIFMSRNIVETTEFFTVLDTMAFANVLNDGIIEKLEYAYEDDIIKEMVNVVYYPLSDMTEEQKTAFDNSMKNNYAAIEEEDFCTVSYHMGNNYYSTTFHFTELDKTENIQKLSELGMLTGAGANKISMSETESSLLAGGYVKK